MSVKITGGTLNLDAILTKIKRQRQKLHIGFFDEENATKAYHNEFGDIGEGGNTPARPFMDDTFQNYQEEWSESLAKLLKRTDYNSEKAFELLGEIVKNNIQQTIQDGNFIPNSPATIAAKGKDNPLIDTHDMFNSVTYKVEKE